MCSSASRSAEEQRMMEYLAGVFVKREDLVGVLNADRQSIKNAILDELLTTISVGHISSQMSDVEEFLNVADEVRATELLVVPLFRAMGFTRVRADEHEQRSLEFGQDIREMKLLLPSEHELYFVAQVKKGPLRSCARSGSSNIAAILLQLETALDKATFDYDSNVQVRPDHAFLVILGTVSQSARLLLEEKISLEKKRRILILDRSNLASLYRKHGLSLEAHVAIRRFLDGRRPANL